MAERAPEQSREPCPMPLKPGRRLRCALWALSIMCAVLWIATGWCFGHVGRVIGKYDYVVGLSWGCIGVGRETFPGVVWQARLHGNVGIAGEPRWQMLPRFSNGPQAFGVRGTGGRVPLWLPLIACAASAWYLGRRERRHVSRCAICGYDLAGLPEGATSCPECGTTPRVIGEAAETSAAG